MGSSQQDNARRGQQPRADDTTLSEENARLHDHIKRWDAWYRHARERLREASRIRAELEELKRSAPARPNDAGGRWQSAYEEAHRENVELANANRSLVEKNRALLARVAQLEQAMNAGALSPGRTDPAQGVPGTPPAPVEAAEEPPAKHARKPPANKPLAENPGQGARAVAPEPQAEAPPAEPAFSYETEEERRVATAFVAWCQRSDPFVSRYSRFETFLKNLIPQARVRLLQRDRRMGQVLFLDDASDPVEYWLVEVASWQGVLPQPQSPKQFRELSPCFEGTAVPKTLSAIKPALLRRDGEGISLSVQGKVL